jgi:quercetin dioxygenase-like cupin family protein
MPGGYTVLEADDASWRPSNLMGVLNADLSGQLSATGLGVRLWRMAPGQANTRHRHFDEHELYVLLEGVGRVRVGEDVLTLAPLSALLVDPETVRQVFNDTETDALWLVVGSPRDFSGPQDITPEHLAVMYPDGPQALPPELAGS